MINSYKIFIFFGIYLVLVAILYFLLFHKHHKKNNIKLDELVELLTKFFSITTISILMFIYGLYIIINVSTHRYDYTTLEIVCTICLGVFIVSAVIINYISYIKRNLKDYDEEKRERARKNNMKIGEVLEVIVFVILILLPVFKIPFFISLKDFKKELCLEIIKSIFMSIAAIFLLYNLNPLNIKEKLKKNTKN